MTNEHSEDSIADLLYKKFCVYGKSYIAMIPNCYTLLENECDILAIKKSGYTDEFEIKISRQDFLKDSDKKVRFKSPNGSYSEWIDKQEAYSKGIMPTNCFWYVAPEGLILPSELPKHAGLMVVNKYGSLQTMKVAKNTTKVKMPQEDIIHHLCKANKKYWRVRCE